MTERPISTVCPQCATEVATELLACPVCRRLVHAQQLSALAVEAGAAEQREDRAEAIRLWREALELLPGNSKQYSAIAQKITTLSGDSPNTPAQDSAKSSSPSAQKSRSGKVVAGATGIGLLLWKLKVVLVLALTKGKLLLLGLTKGGTFLTMALSFGIYWSAWGWPFALGLVLSIYIHEMGHIDALRRLGFKATAPMFIPGLGAVIRLKQHPLNASEDARIGLAGPFWGLAAAAAAYGVFMTTHKPIWGAIAHLGAWINLFNLVPIWQLDGGRGFRALSRQQGWMLVILAAATWMFTAEGMMLLVLIAAIAQTAAKTRETTGDGKALALYGLLMVALALLSRIQVPMNLS